MANISYKNTHYFSNLIIDYLSEKETVKEFYTNFFNEKGFKNQIKLKQDFSVKKREVLVKELTRQYKNITLSKAVSTNIELLNKNNTFTVTTGHQLNLFTGPLYFLYKIISTLNLAKQLKEKFTNINFVPIYWMATEDHDFDEINFFNLKHKKITWKSNQKGAVGNFCTKELKEVLQKLKVELGISKNATALLKLFEESYVKHCNLEEATRYLVNKLFGNLGIVVLDANSVAFKKQFSSIVREELLSNTAFENVLFSNKALKKKGYATQVNPRKINLFYLDDNLRERIVFKEGKYIVNGTNLSFSKQEILEELDKKPEKFSPNVIMRPLYQETILPNLAYIGGGGELAYWFQLKKYFKSVGEKLPILVLRNSVLLLTAKQKNKLKKLHISLEELFLPLPKLIDKKIKEISEIKIDFSPQEQLLQNSFKELKQMAKKTDVTFLNAVNAQERKQLRGLKVLEKRLLKAQKRKHLDVVSRIKILHNEIFPNGKLQERTSNFSEFYALQGERLLPMLVKKINPLTTKFKIVTITY